MPGTKVAEELRREQIITAAYQLATRCGLRTLTIRDVAKRADTSTGLVIFHFGTKERLLLALLDHVLATTITLRLGPAIAAIEDPLERLRALPDQGLATPIPLRVVPKWAAISDPLERLLALLRHEMARLSTEPMHNRLFFEFWSEGIWNRAVRTRMQRELDRYRAAFRPMTEEVIASDPERFTGMTPESLAAVAVSFIKGCAVQSMIEPNLDVIGFLRAAEALLAPASAGTRRPGE